MKPVTKKNNPKISLVVCTYNREQLLPGCLESMARQQVDTDCYEVLVVDNNSKDNTREVAGEFIKKYPNFRYAFEPQQGLSHARNLGIKEAKADYIAYIDDDARISKYWIKIALKIIDEKQPDIFGGPAYPLFPDGKPEWFKEEYGIRGDMGKTGWLHKGFIIGTNIVFKKSLFREYGSFDPELGMKGDQLAYGEETRLVFRALKEGKKVYYSREMAVQDQLPDYKKSLAFFIYNWYRVGKDLRTIDNQSFADSELQHLLKLIDSTFNQLDIALHKSKRNLQLFPYPENYIIENLKENFIQIGKRMGYFLKQGNLVPEKLIEILLNSYQPGEIARKIAVKQGLFKTTREMVSAWFRHLKKKRSKSPGKDTPLYKYKVDQVLEQLKENEDLILELGAGKTKRGNGWITLDNNPFCHIVHDLRKPLPFPPNTFKTVYSSHVLEHFAHHQLVNLLKEVLRILRVGGIFSICVPDAAIYINAYSNPGNFNADFYCRYKPAVHFYSKIDYLNYMAYMDGHHKIMFDDENLPAILKSVGFRNVSKRNFDRQMDLEKRDYESLYFNAEK